MSSGFMNSWSHSIYYQDLLNQIDSDIHNTYDEYLNCTYDYDHEMRHHNSNDILLIKAVRYGDLELSKKLLKNTGGQVTNNIGDWLLECSVRSNNLNMVKFVVKNTSNISSWMYALIESIDTNNLEIINYISQNTGYLRRHNGFAHSVSSKKYHIAQHILNHGFNHNLAYANFDFITFELIDQIKKMNC